MSTPHCFENPPTLNPTSGRGSVEEFEGLIQTYITGPRQSDRALLLICDGFGYEAPYLRKLADKFADEGYLVLVPDFLYGDPVQPGIPGFDPRVWGAAHTAEKGAEDAIAIITALKNKGVSAVGAAGFCWGGEVVVRLAKHDLLQAGVVLHPGPLTAELINEVKIPIALLGAEKDESCLAHHLVNFGKILSAKPGIESESYTKIFPDVNHGWTLRYNTDDEFAVKSAEEAHADTLNWLNNYIK